MAFINMNFSSQVLGKNVQACVIVPQRYWYNQNTDRANFKKMKCLFLLHGLTDDNTIWQRRTSIERYSEKYGICVVMPDAEKSFYTDMKHGDKYYTFIAKELPGIVRDIFDISDRREDMFIAGLSMGGYGALKIGMRECDTFCACAGLSSVADIEEGRKLFPDVMKTVFGEDMIIPPEENLFDIASACDKNPNKPRVYMGVGLEDALYGGNARLKKHFESLSFDYTYRESHGTHSWVFWDEYIQYVLEWMFG